MVKAIWNVTDNFGQPCQVRLTEEGKLEKGNCGRNSWELLGVVDLSIFSVRDVRDMLRGMEGIAKVVRERV